MLYEGWSVDNFFNLVTKQGITAVDDHYKSLSTRFGYEIKTPESVVNQAGYTLMGQNQLEAAIAVLERNVRDFPESANVYDSMGDAYKANKELKKAADSYGKACSMATAVNHANAAVYCNNAEEIKKEME